MSRWFALTLTAATLLLVGSCSRQPPWQWKLPKGFPEPVVPADNPMTSEKVALGRRLFYDKRLSQNQTQACGSCHQQSRGFSDGRTTALGSTGQLHFRNSMALTNVAYASHLTWANPLIDRLEAQALLPMFGDNPVEMGLADEETLLTRLRDDTQYRDLFAAAFSGESTSITLPNVTRALASFERTIISGNSPYDRFSRGDQQALSDSAKRGMQHFFSERLECFHCHGGFNFSDAMNHAGLPEPERAFHNNGLYNVDRMGAYPERDRGLIKITGKLTDMGRFKAPTLRNIAVTAPYMHDGSIATLGEVLDHYANGGRTIESGPDAGDGSVSPNKSTFLIGFILSDDERADVVAFLESLTDEKFLRDPALSDPFTSEPGATR